MEANDNTRGPSFEACKALVADLVANLRPGPDGLASHAEIYRQLERMRPGSLDRAHARQTLMRLGVEPRLPTDVKQIDWSAVDFAGA